MSRSSTPGFPAGRHSAPHGNRARSLDYPEEEIQDEQPSDPALVTSPGQGGVGVFQPPRPTNGRGVPPVEPSPPMLVGDGTDIDSPFLDLFGGPGAQPHPGPPPPVSSPRRGREHPPIPHQPAAPPASAAPQPAIAADTPAAIEAPAADRPARARVPHQPGDRLPVLRPPAEPEPAADRPVETPAPRVPRAMPAEPLTAREATERSRREAVERARREATARARRETVAPVRPEPTEPAEPEWPEPEELPRSAPAGSSRREVEEPARRAIAEPGRRELAEPGPQEPAERTSRELAPPRQRAASRRTPAKPVRVRPPKIKFGDRDPSIDLAITEIAGHLTFTPNTVTAWYWLPEVRWAFRPDAEREALLSAISEQYAGLAGFRLHLRRTTRPFPADEWARTIDAHTAAPLPDVPGTPGWADHLVAAQRHLMSVNHAEGQTYLGVTFARRSLGDSLTERLLRTFGRGTADGERRKLGRTVEQFDEVLGAFGMRGRRVTAQELEWLLYRSVALCMAPPGTLSPVTNGRWERGDLLALTEQVERYRTPYGSTVKLVNRMTGEERHVAVLAVGRMEPLEIPERHEPWLHFHERLPWPMEISTRVDILGSGDSFRNLEHRLRMIRSQQLDYAEHGIDAPPELERLAKRALVIGDEMTTGLPVDSARAHGWHRIAVGGRTREECLERARRLIQLYSRELRISLQHPKNQDWLAREFIPGEPIANTGYVRRMPVNLLAAALPQAASTVGDRRGDLIGRTAGTCRRPVFLDLHFPMEVRERSGLAVFVAEPGGGKSTLLGALGYLAARRGVQVTLLDPSGPLARLCAMPELRPYARVLNLTGSEHGTLAPYSLIPTPLRSEFGSGAAGDREFEIAVSNARAERRMLVQDICMMLVPPQVAREASTATLFRHAVRQVPAEETSTLDDVVACLQGMDDDAGRELANLLLDTAEMPLAMLFFGRPPEGLLGADAALTVITMAGLRLPDLKIEREYWSAEEALALPMLHTAHRLAVRRCYGGSMSSRKLVGLDEAHFMEGWRSGRSFLVRLARDSRKWNLAALVASQNPKDILGLDVQNLVSTVFVGRIAEDAEIASEALRLLRVPVDDGYEATLASLSAVDATSADRLGFREFVMRDVDGRVQKVRVDVSYVEGLLAHLDTTPAGVAQVAGQLPTVLADLEA
ncbi:ATP-binding protein [Micromonospora sp. CPCC 206171]|uniref:ATP-binding protein n=1 Tax=Micromonospora sp. CPCC 206171 TaxID=3122405 RepID=UPI002FF3CEDC